MSGMEWSESQFKELTAYDKYRMGRDQVVPCAPREDQRHAITPLQEDPPISITYTQQPYANGTEATKDFADGVFKITLVLAKPALAIVTVWGACSVIAAFFSGVAAGAAIAGLTMAWPTLAAVGLMLLLGIGSLFGVEKNEAAKAGGSVSSQTINVNVNVSGGNLNTNLR